MVLTSREIQPWVNYAHGYKMRGSGHNLHLSDAHTHPLRKGLRMRVVSESKRIIGLILIMLVAVTFSTTLAIAMLYETSFEQSRSQLVQSAKDQADLMDAVLMFDREHHSDLPHTPGPDTLVHIRNAYDQYPSDGQIGEITLAQQRGGKIVYLVTHGRVDDQQVAPIPLDSHLAEPMQRALAGQTGSMIGLDYRGVRVLAAYRPVPALQAGVVAKMDLSDLRAPFLRAGLLVIALAMVLITSGAIMFVRLTSPIVKRLSEREAQLHLILESTGEGIFGIDNAFRCTFVNSAALRMLGYRDSGQLLGRAMHALIHPSCGDGAGRPLSECPIYTACHEQPAGRVERDELWRADQTHFPAEYRVYPMLRHGEIVGRLFTFTDITERKEREAQEVHAQKMELIGQLMGGIAHDFNNLLAIILVNLRMLLKDHTANRRDEETGELLEDTLSAAENGAELMERLLTFSRKQASEPRLVDINSLVRDFQVILRRVSGDGIALILQLADAPQHAFIDPQQFENAVLNLAINARDAMPDGGTLSIRVENLNITGDQAHTLGLEHPESYIAVHVEDTGYGMAPDVARHAIEPFYTTKPPGKGSGLGLSMVYRFTQQAGGSLQIDSTPGQGTSITLFLPFASTSEDDAEMASRSDPAAGMPRGMSSILLVEDDERLRRFASSVLAELGYQVLEADDSDAAIALLDSDIEIDLLFTDVVLPGEFDGRQLALWALEHHRDLPVLLTSGQLQETHDNPADQPDTLPFLKKPYSKQQLQAAIQALV